MKKMALSVVTFFICIFCLAQNKPLNGSGKTVKKTFAYNQFDKLELTGLNGNVMVTVGKTFAIEVTIDDNLAGLLDVKENNGKLTIGLAGNKNNKLYLEKNKISIAVSMPEISVLKSDANCNIVVQKIVGRYLRVENYSNGSMVLSGTIDQLDITKEGNGNIEAAALIAKNTAARVDGNGTVTIYAKESFAVSGSGNGNVINVGKGKLKAGSEIKGNGEIITSETE
jgi:hypothetical protein